MFNKLKQFYKTIKRQTNIFLERPYVDDNGKYHTNGNLVAIITRETELEHPKSADEIKLVSCGRKFFKAINEYEKRTGRKFWK